MSNIDRERVVDTLARNIMHHTNREKLLKEDVKEFGERLGHCFTQSAHIHEFIKQSLWAMVPRIGVEKQEVRDRIEELGDRG
jgi:hypothetical protein